ncbi:hypothetical protein [Nocardioides pyridinolyticus]
MNEERRDAGMSVVEMVVAAGLVVVLGTMVMTVAILGVRTSAGLEVRLDNSVQGELGIAATGKVLRTAVLPAQLDEQACDSCADTAIVQAAGTRVTFYANIENTGGGPSLVTLEVLADPARADGTAMLRQTRVPPTPLPGGKYEFCDPAAATCVTERRVLARGLVWPSPRVFTYYDFDGAPIAGTAVAGTDLPSISSVDVSIAVQTAPGRAEYPTTTTVQRIRLPNADLNVIVEPS